MSLLPALSDWKATGLVAVPAGFALLFRLSGDKLGEYAEQLRYIEIGSAPMPQANKERLMQRQIQRKKRQKTFRMVSLDPSRLHRIRAVRKHEKISLTAVAKKTGLPVSKL